MTLVKSLMGVALYRNNPKSVDYLMMGVGDKFYEGIDNVWVRIGIDMGQPYVDHSTTQFDDNCRLLPIRPLSKDRLNTREMHLTGTRSTKAWAHLACPARGFAKSTVSTEDRESYARSLIDNWRVEPSKGKRITVPKFEHNDLTIAIVEGTHALHTLSAEDRAALLTHFDQYRFDTTQIALVLGCSPKTIQTWRRNVEAGPGDDINVKEVIKQALLDAIQWEESLAETSRNSPEDKAAALAQAKAYRVVLRQRYGSDKTVLDAALERANVVHLSDMMRVSK